MVRQRNRKGIEDVYGLVPKDKEKSDICHGNVDKSQNGHQSGKVTMRTDRDYAGYVISSNTPYNVMPAAHNMDSKRVGTARRKSARIPSKPEKLMDNMKGENTDRNKTRNVRVGGGDAPAGESKYRFNSAINAYDTSRKYNSPMLPEEGPSALPSVHERHCSHTHRHGRHHHSHGHNDHSHSRSRGGEEQTSRPAVCNDEKDDEADEFVSLIRNTVNKAITHSVSDIVNRNYRQLSMRVDRFSTELKTTNTILNQAVEEINNKVAHYGEENSRHFRYLCMKSEYDKMFYQHQAMINTPGSQSAPFLPTTPRPPAGSSEPVVPIVSQKCTKNRPQCSIPGNSKNSADQCIACHCSRGDSTERHSEHCVSQKSSEGTMLDVIDHLQRFCKQMKQGDNMNGHKLEAEGYRRQNKSIPMNERYHRPNDDAANRTKKMYASGLYDDDEEDLEIEDDEDEFNLSSDSNTPRSVEQRHSREAGNGCIAGEIGKAGGDCMPDDGAMTSRAAGRANGNVPGDA